MIKLNENRTQRRVGFFFLGVYVFILIVYLFFDGWHYEWLHYGYDGINQHWDWNVIGDMQWELIDGKPVYYSTNNLHNLVYTCYWIAVNSVFALILDNKFLRQGAMATLAFPVISFFSTINPYVAKEVFTTDIFFYHSYGLQIVYDLNHISGTIMGVYIFYIAAKRNEEIDLKKIAPMILFTWVLFILARVTLQKWPFWAPVNEVAMIGTNQINDMPFIFYGLEYIIVVALLYAINILVKAVNKHISNPKMKTVFPFVLFAVLTIIFIMADLIVLQVIPWQRFIQ